MPWLAKRPDRGESETAASLAPVELVPPLDAERFAARLASLQAAVNEIGVGGLDALLGALERKSLLFREALAADGLEGLEPQTLALLLDTVMPARRRIGEALTRLAPQALRGAVQDLIEGTAALGERLETFARTLVAPLAPPDERTARRLQRGALDFAAEILHFREPDRYPLMTRWVWDASAASGALRELARGADAVKDFAWGDSPGVYEAGRRWIAAQLREHGVWRESPFMVDLYLAHVYTGYLFSMSAGLGLLKPDFGASGDPLEITKKLLGVDDRGNRGSWVKRVASH
jgi:hypothetical protein